ncbi:hypothetical protein C8F01DRAFT_1121545 [Mycena amicta]|nr:hypothetical protein C8F01DRAFT_1121545 [Mycena amicta]
MWSAGRNAVESRPMFLLLSMLFHVRIFSQGFLVSGLCLLTPSKSGCMRILSAVCLSLPDSASGKQDPRLSSIPWT